jgi:hypothetical protein
VRILIIHQVPFRKVHYDRVIDHAEHDVIYLGRDGALANIPADLRCQRISLGAFTGRPEHDDTFNDQVRMACPDIGQVDSVVSLSEFGLLAGALARRHFGLPAVDDEQVMLVRDKVAMKQRLAGVGVRVPRFGTLGADPAELGWCGPTVVKPRDGASSNGVSVYPTATQALIALRERGAGYELEEFITGDVLHIDGSVLDGVLVDPVVSVCIGTPLQFAQGQPIASHQISAPASVLELAGEVIRGLRLERGAIHLELIRGERELVFLEIGHRVGGAGVLTGYQRHTGIDLAATEICRQAGLADPPRSAPSGLFHGFLMCPQDDARVRGAAAPCSWLREHPDVVAVHTAPPRTSESGVTYQEWELPLFVEYADPSEASLAATLAEHLACLIGDADD